MKSYSSVFFIFILSFSFIQAQNFDLIPLGIYGGSDESNLSAYLLGEKDKNEFISLDAGTLHAGIDKAIMKKTFKVSSDTVLKKYIKGYFISHGHLDHLAGLIINSPEDTPKNIYGLSPVINILKNFYFTNGPWINFANEGNPPILNKYKYISLNPLEKFKIENTHLQGQIFQLSHGNPYIGSAVLINSNQKSILYLGDTGADRIEKSNQLDILWKSISPLLIQHRLLAILIEVSFPNSQPETSLFGHLTPALLQEELGKLATYAGKDHLKNLPVIITHLKPSGNNIDTIKKELQENNVYGIKLIFPVQGEKIVL